MYSNPRSVIVENAPNIFSRNKSVYLQLSQVHILRICGIFTFDFCLENLKLKIEISEIRLFLTLDFELSFFLHILSFKIKEEVLKKGFYTVLCPNVPRTSYIVSY